MKLDYSTMNVQRLRTLPLYRVQPGHHVSEHLGAGCFLDAPGFPSYFLQAVYNRYGDHPRQGPEYVIADPEREGDYRVVDEIRDNLACLWLPLPMEHPRVSCWEYECYRHLRSCYDDPSMKDGLLIWPPSNFDLIGVAIETKEEQALVRQSIGRQSRFIWTAEMDNTHETITWHYEFRVQIHSSAEHDWVHFFCEHMDQAVPENHRAVKTIRQFYPNYRPNLDMIVHAPVEVLPSWWERHTGSDDTNNE